VRGHVVAFARSFRGSKEAVARRRYLGGDVTRGPTTQVGRSPYRRRQTVHHTPGACRARHREPCQSKRNRNRQLQARRATRSPEASRLKTRPHRAKRARHAMQSKDRREGRRDSHRRTRSEAGGHARPAPPRQGGQPGGARNRGRGPLHDAGEPGGEATSGGPFNTTRSDTQHKNGWPGGTECQSGQSPGTRTKQDEPRSPPPPQQSRQGGHGGERCVCPTPCTYAGGHVPRPPRPRAPPRPTRRGGGPAGHQRARGGGTEKQRRAPRQPPPAPPPSLPTASARQSNPRTGATAPSTPRLQ
jgi:hypothetical protein